jgi:hypothetical protein
MKICLKGVKLVQTLGMWRWHSLIFGLSYKEHGSINPWDSIDGLPFILSKMSLKLLNREKMRSVMSDIEANVFSILIPQT